MLLAIWEVCPCEGSDIARNLSEALVFNANRLLPSFYRLNPPVFGPCGVVQKHSQNGKREKKKKKKKKGGRFGAKFCAKTLFGGLFPFLLISSKFCLFVACFHRRIN